jgi:hypothetical protein
MLGLIFEHRQKLWQYVFADTDSRLDNNTRIDIVKHSIDMYLDNKKQKKIKGENYEAFVSCNGKYYTMGCFGGREYKVRADTEFGKTKLSFLIAEVINSSLN